MDDLRKDFKNWLLTVKKYKETTADRYIGRISSIYKKNFAINKLYMERDDWRILSENILSLLSKYYELSIKDYYVDRVTIIYALEYFDKISDFLYSANPAISDDIAKIYLFDGRDDYFFTSTSVKTLSIYLYFINLYLYESTYQPVSEHIFPPVPLEVIAKLSELPKAIPAIDNKKLAVHIVYDKKDIQNTKTLLSTYCDFLYAIYKPQYDYKNNSILQTINKNNPNKTINDNFIETRPITGEQARQVKPNLKVKRETEFGYVYTLQDLAAIFCIDYKTTINLINRFGAEHTIITTINHYYSNTAANDCLKAYHHYKDKKETDKYPSVDYTLEGKEQWCTRNEAIKLLRIGKHAFYHYIFKKCLYIDYAEKAPKYYIPEMKYLVNTPNIKRVGNRKKYNIQ